jgi:hypothetical protein
MANMWDRLQSLWNKARAGETRTPACFSIKAEDGNPFSPQQHYFQIIINEMFLANEREWFVTYSPMTFVAATYIYNNNRETSPFIVGPSMLEEYGYKLPQGMVFRNTPVTSLHPYQGGELILTVILYKVQRRNNVDTVLKVLEKISSVINPAVPAIDFSSYLKIAGSIMDGVEILLGLEETLPVVGYRLTINPDIGQRLEPTYMVLIDSDEREIKKGEFLVRESRLHCGSQPYREKDFALLKIAQGDRRTDEQTLPFYPLWETTLEMATRSANNHFWDETKAHFKTLNRALLNSPDLTKPDYDRLSDEYLAEVKEQRERAIALGSLRTTSEVSEEETRARRMAEELDELDDL